MRLLLVIAPEQFRDEELQVPQKIFAREGIEYDIASTRTGRCEGMLGASAEATLCLEDVDARKYRGIVIIGGMGSQDYLWGNSTLISLVKAFFESGKVVAAICLSPVVLAQAGVLKGREATFFRSPASVKEMEKGGAHLVDFPVVADLDLITANGPQAAEEFAKTVREKLGC
ncbi:MAG: DJ-1/PfpI family protein [Methanomicrobiaceae archaeon]|nr:DJ-1/PfpI family protein [Methanomicrobiaceae archaeon]